MTNHDSYRGVPLKDIEVSSVLWSEEASAYIRTRSSRRPRDRDIEPEWATEAATWSGAMGSWAPPPPGSEAIESESLMILGFSESARSVLRVWVRPLDMDRGEWLGVNAAFVKRSVARRLLEGGL